MRGYLAKLAAIAVVVAGLISINTGLAMSGSSFTLTSALGAITGRADAEQPAAGAPGATMGASGVQQVAIQVGNTSYSPSSVQAKAGAPTRLVLTTNGTRGCTRSFVVPSMNLQKALPETGATTIDLGVLRPGQLRYTCSMGMYRGVINVT